VNFSRIDLADCATPQSLLTTIHKLIGGVFPVPVPVDEWALKLDIEAIEALETEGFEGGLVMFADRSSGTILVSQNADRRRRRFTIGHELGHFLLPWHTPRDPAGFRCTKQDFATFSTVPGGDRYKEMEAQANQFAAGLLMPTAPFRAELRARRNFGVEHIAEIAERYDVSKEAAARRCVELHDDDLAVIISKQGKIVRVYPGKDFPRLSAWLGAKLPAGSVSSRVQLAPGQVSAWGELPADVWLESPRGSISEQALGQINNFRLTLLSFEPDQDEDDEEVQSNWREPAFRRR
jgi:hypothetical protein